MKKWKLKDKLKQLKYCSYRYKIVTSVDNFIKHDYQGDNIIKLDDEVTFFARKINYELLTDELCQIIDIYKNIFKSIIKERFLLLIVIPILIFLFLSSNFFIREITFQNEIFYNHEVYKMIETSLRKIGPFYTLNTPINELSNELKENFPEYAYIGASKKGAKIIIEIEKQEEYDHITEDETIGDLVASKAGRICGIEVKQGLVVVNTSQLVVKGELLVSANMLYKINPNDETKLVSSTGFVYATTIDYRAIEIPKRNSFSQYTGNIKTSYGFSLFNKEGEYNNEYTNSFLRVEELITLKNIVMIKKYYEYEIIQQDDVIDIEKAIIQGEIKIASAFEEKRVSNMEKIEYIRFIKSEENANSFTCFYLVKTIENIAVKVHR